MSPGTRVDFSEAREGRQTGQPRRKGRSEGRSPGRVTHSKAEPVVRTLEGHDARRAAREQRRLQRDLHRVGTRCAEHHPRGRAPRVVTDQSFE